MPFGLIEISDDTEISNRIILTPNDVKRSDSAIT